MNALVSVRANQTGFLSPTPGQRKEVAVKLMETATARAGKAEAFQAPATAAMGATASSVASSPADDVLGKEAFLQLLVLQLQNQDPLEPVGNGEMLAQLAQFSALEAQTNLNESFETLSGNIDQLNFIASSQLLGKTVKGVDLEGVIREGIVEGVHLDGSVVMLTVDGALMSMAGILEIGQPPGKPGGTPDTSPTR